MISIIMPCLNEEGSVGYCVGEAIRSLKLLRGPKFKSEIIVIDNGSFDGSVAVARKARAMVVFEKNKGYGNALLRGIREAKGEIIVMGDSDGSYDWGEIGRLTEPYDKNALLDPSATLQDDNFLPDIVVGSRLKGRIENGAMPVLNRYLGTPILNFFLRLFYGIKLSDSQSGFRAFRKEAIEKLNLKSGGMEFASEMLVKAKQAGLNISEVPISYHRRLGKSKLSPVRDAWRHIKFMLLFSPTWLFLVPGIIIGLIGIVGLVRLSFGPLYIGQRYFDIHTMIVFSFVATLGFQITFLGLFAKVYASLFLDQKDNLIEKLINWFTLEKGLVVGGVLVFWGSLGFLGVLGAWVKGGLGALDAARPVLLSITILSLAVQAIFGSFFFALLGSKWER